MTAMRTGIYNFGRTGHQFSLPFANYKGHKLNAIFCFLYNAIPNALQNRFHVLVCRENCGLQTAFLSFCKDVHLCWFA